MQDRYAGDIGDYGKFGFLRALESEGLFVGVNWYLAFPGKSELDNRDGKHLIPADFDSCDPNLASSLCTISTSPAEKRSVASLETARLLKSDLYFSDRVEVGTQRISWHRRALEKLAPADLVFLDPDNGLLAKSVRRMSEKAVKYVFDDEVRDYLARGQVVVFYHHRPRKKPEVHFPEMTARIETLAEGLNPQIFWLTFRRRSVRDYFIVCPDGVHGDQTAAAVSSMHKSPWNQMTDIVRKQQIC